ncbi:orotidine 5'-phosphate decarboxylase [Neorickettsia helminthoeca str. Oregon]|uniref:Orotidine 5'-phosphate decarboxylase n=1 Tax=Neorickettsia helminthoeca str. Oregon TaxID=1286528 RepID=X5HKT8_9RICK|nr:orotidine-5'-phosphate decarboxylase [Neorickettsia helminthoeca]AHX11684.1 orotidine 5'-phosphate decarboxylase [Neorickettsia helminthoeca str. Oregon]
MKPKIVCAIDNPDFGYSYSLVASISDHIHVVKLGSEFFSSCGISGVEKIASIGLPIFLDLKLHDIPNTVSKTIEVIRKIRGIKFLTVHITGGKEMILAARRALVNTKICLLGVSALTSLSQEDLISNRIREPLPEYVKNLSLFGKNCGLDGVICSVQESLLVRQACGKDFIIVAPGISSSSLSDQKRVVDIFNLPVNEADYVVIGRAITQAPCPLDVARRIMLALKTERRDLTKEESQ